MGFLEKVKRGFAEAVDKESRAEAASVRESERQKQIRELKTENAVERAKRAHAIRSKEPFSVKEMMKSKFREGQRNMKIESISSFNRDALASGARSRLRDIAGVADDFFDAPTPKGRKQESFKMDFGFDIDSMLGTPRRQSPSKTRYEPVFNRKGKRIGSRVVKQKKGKRDPWDIDIGF